TPSGSISVCLMAVREVGKVKEKRTAIGLALIIISSAAVSLFLAVLLAIFLGPGKPAPFFFAVRVFTAVGFLTDGDPAFSPGSGEHPLTTYLCAFTNCNAIALHPYEKAPAGYGSKSFYRDLDRDAPEFNKSTRSDAPVMLNMYPFGYYTLAALWVAAIRVFSTRPTASFFGMKFLSSILLTASLLLVYATCRELRMGAKRSLLFTGIFGFFPLTSFMSSYIQPDNLSLTLVMFCCYTGLLVHRCP